DVVCLLQFNAEPYKGAGHQQTEAAERILTEKMLRRINLRAKNMQKKHGGNEIKQRDDAHGCDTQRRSSLYGWISSRSAFEGHCRSSPGVRLDIVRSIR